MIPAAYYNEIDSFAAQWLRNLIAAGHIAPGEVDERSIEDVTPDDLRGFTQCHFFAGIGVWSHSLRLAGWPDDKPVWTGSCPCQPFSAAGKGDGFADERHLWPAFFHLISECRPQHVFGEQSASADANNWIDLVQADLEAMGYAFGACAFPSASVGAPHIRDRAYWVADTNREQYKECLPGRAESHCAEACWPSVELTRFCLSGGVAYTSGKGSQRRLSGGQDAQREAVNGHSGCGSTDSRPLEVNGFWRDADWLFCRDGQWRPVESGTFPLVARFAKSLGHGKSSLRAMAGRNRTGRLKGYGNAINAQAAAEFIRAYMGVSYGR
ncbi:DNA cytosine methyltransferase [Citrobacter freundii]|uniref:DNA cytosine methyltransferase n=1 Tax=Citrobacter freundii TaxID=546 RepID=UPI001901421F|nr:DNA cytosine methyltransferase [Citrobacter freundii]MBJ8984107.1 DNA cytosine methyltransferase [Citrobacter freundii]